jgi:elongation factor G
VHHLGSEQIRNIVLLSHSGAGKTSLAEIMLFNAKATGRLGKVDDGTTVSDYDPEESKRKISINLSVLPFEWKNTKINILDTPGYPDFIAEVKSGVRVCEGAVIVICAASSVEVGTEQVWDYVDGKLPSFIFINKMDRDNANFYDTMKDINAKFGAKCAPVQLPIGSQKDFKGYVDLITKKAFAADSAAEIEVPSDLQSQVDSYRDKLIEAIVEVDDDLISRYLDGEEINEEDIYRCLKEATVQGKVVPVLVGSALNNGCITSLMDALIAYIPSPKDAGPVKLTDVASGDEQTVEPVSDSTLTALVFKTTTDPHVGKISYFRVYSGTLASNSQVWNVSKKANERIGQVSVVRGKTQESVAQIEAGDIGAVAKLTVTATNDTLGVKDKALVLDMIEFPEPILTSAVYPKSKADLDKMGTALPKISEEDPTLDVRREPDTGELLLCGMGDTHLDVATEKLSRKFGVDVKLELPKVPYKETITSMVQADYKHKKQTGGHGQYGHVMLELEPLERGSGFEFAERVVGGSVPKNYIPAVEKGVNEAKLEGILAKYPAVDVKVTLYDGSYHPVDSSEMSFKIAATQAFKKGLTQGQPILLEPIVNIRILVPDAFTGDVIGDLNSKRARVQGMNPENGMNTIDAQAPLAEVLRYAIDLRSMTQGRGTFKTEFSHYEEVPAQIAQKIIAQKQKEQE